MDENIATLNDGADASLSGLVVDPGKLLPEFWGTRTSFAVALPHQQQTIRIKATSSHSEAKFSINGRNAVSDEWTPPFALEVGRTVFEVAVESPDKTNTKTYELRVHRAHDRPDWVRVLEQTPWTPRDSAGQLVFKDRMWIFGGYVPELVSDVWSTADGKEWTRQGEIPAHAGINIPVNFVHDNRMWVSSNDGKLFASADGAAWNLVSDALPCLPRYGAGCAVFEGRMWILAGVGQGQAYNDVWSSHDGVEWTRELDEAPWSRRQLFGNVAVHAGKLWVIGGGLTFYQPFKAYRDVWCSENGRDWTQVTDQAPWPARIWSDCAVFRNRLWLLGGYRAQPQWNNFNDVWYSPDGVEWKELTTPTIWEPRHEVSPYVHDGKLWVIGGNAWPLMNDVWQLDLPRLAFISQPVLEEFLNCRYDYHARADFNHSCLPVTYRLTSGPDWLSIDTATGHVHGVPPELGDFAVVIEASDEAGEVAVQEYTLSVISI